MYVCLRINIDWKSQHRKWLIRLDIQLMRKRKDSPESKDYVKNCTENIDVGISLYHKTHSFVKYNLNRFQIFKIEMKEDPSCMIISQHHLKCCNFFYYSFEIAWLDMFFSSISTVVTCANENRLCLSLGTHNNRKYFLKCRVYNKYTVCFDW